MKRANGLDEFYSRTLPNDGLELFVDRNGNPTINYPHVHVIHHGSSGKVTVIASVSSGNHVWRKELSGNPSGHEVDAAVREARNRI